MTTATQTPEETAAAALAATRAHIAAGPLPPYAAFLVSTMHDHARSLRDYASPDPWQDSIRAMPRAERAERARQLAEIITDQGAHVRALFDAQFSPDPAAAIAAADRARDRLIIVRALDAAERAHDDDHARIFREELATMPA